MGSIFQFLSFKICDKGTKIIYKCCSAHIYSEVFSIIYCGDEVNLENESFTTGDSQNTDNQKNCMLVWNRIYSNHVNINDTSIITKIINLYTIKDGLVYFDDLLTEIIQTINLSKIDLPKICTITRIPCESLVDQDKDARYYCGKKLLNIAEYDIYLRILYVAYKIGLFLESIYKKKLCAGISAKPTYRMTHNQNMVFSPKLLYRNLYIDIDCKVCKQPQIGRTHNHKTINLDYQIEAYYNKVQEIVKSYFDDPLNKINCTRSTKYLNPNCGAHIYFSITLARFNLDVLLRELEHNLPKNDKFILDLYVKGCTLPCGRKHVDFDNDLYTYDDWCNIAPLDPRVYNWDKYALRDGSFNCREHIIGMRSLKFQRCCKNKSPTAMSSHQVDNIEFGEAINPTNTLIYYYNDSGPGPLFIEQDYLSRRNYEYIWNRLIEFVESNISAEFLDNELIIKNGIRINFEQYEAFKLSVDKFSENGEANMVVCKDYNEDNLNIEQEERNSKSNANDRKYRGNLRTTPFEKYIPYKIKKDNDNDFMVYVYHNRIINLLRQFKSISTHFADATERIKNSDEAISIHIQMESLVDSMLDNDAIIMRLKDIFCSYLTLEEKTNISSNVVTACPEHLIMSIDEYDDDETENLSPISINQNIYTRIKQPMGAINFSDNEFRYPHSDYIMFPDKLPITLRLCNVMTNMEQSSNPIEMDLFRRGIDMMFSSSDMLITIPMLMIALKKEYNLNLWHNCNDTIYNEEIENKLNTHLATSYSMMRPILSKIVRDQDQIGYKRRRIDDETPIVLPEITSTIITGNVNSILRTYEESSISMIRVQGDTVVDILLKFALRNGFVSSTYATLINYFAIGKQSNKLTPHAIARCLFNSFYKLTGHTKYIIAQMVDQFNDDELKEWASVNFSGNSIPFSVIWQLRPDEAKIDFLLPFDIVTKNAVDVLNLVTNPNFTTIWIEYICQYYLFPHTYGSDKKIFNGFEYQLVTANDVTSIPPAYMRIIDGYANNYANIHSVANKYGFWYRTTYGIFSPITQVLENNCPTLNINMYLTMKYVSNIDSVIFPNNIHKYAYIHSIHTRLPAFQNLISKNGINHTILAPLILPELADRYNPPINISLDLNKPYIYETMPQSYTINYVEYGHTSFNREDLDQNYNNFPDMLLAKLKNHDSIKDQIWNKRYLAMLILLLTLHSEVSTSQEMPQKLIMRLFGDRSYNINGTCSSDYRKKISALKKKFFAETTNRNYIEHPEDVTNDRDEFCYDGHNDGNGERRHLNEDNECENENIIYENMKNPSDHFTHDDDNSNDAIEYDDIEIGQNIASDENTTTDENKKNPTHSIFFDKLNNIIKPEIEKQINESVSNISQQLQNQCNIVSNNEDIKLQIMCVRPNQRNKSNIGATLNKFLFLSDVFDPNNIEFQELMYKVNFERCPAHFVKLAFLVMIFLQKRGNYCFKTPKSKFLQYMVSNRNNDYQALVAFSKVTMGPLLCARNGLETALILKAFVDKTETTFKTPIQLQLKNRLFYRGSEDHISDIYGTDVDNIECNKHLIDDYTLKSLLTITHRDLNNPCLCCPYSNREKENICTSIVVDVQQAAGNLDIYYELLLLKLKIAFPGPWSKEIFLFVGYSNSGKTNYCENYLVRIFECRDKAKISATSLFQNKSTNSNIHHISNTPLAIIDEVAVINPQILKLTVDPSGQETRRLFSATSVPFRNLCKIIMISNLIPTGAASDDGTTSRIRVVSQHHWFSPMEAFYDRTIQPVQTLFASSVLTIQFSEKKFPQDDTYVKDYAVSGGINVLWNFSNIMFYQTPDKPVDCIPSYAMCQNKIEMLINCDDMSRFFSRVTIIKKECSLYELSQMIRLYIQTYYRGNSKLFDSLTQRLTSTLPKIQSSTKTGELRFTQSFIIKP